MAMYKGGGQISKYTEVKGSQVKKKGGEPGVSNVRERSYKYEKQEYQKEL